MRRGKIVLILLLAAIACFLTGVLIWGIRAGQGEFGESLRRSFSIGQGSIPRKWISPGSGRSVWTMVP